MTSANRVSILVPNVSSQPSHNFRRHVRLPQFAAPLHTHTRIHARTHAQTNGQSNRRNKKRHTRSDVPSDKDSITRSDTDSGRYIRNIPRRTSRYFCISFFFPFLFSRDENPVVKSAWIDDTRCVVYTASYYLQGDKDMFPLDFTFCMEWLTKKQAVLSVATCVILKTSFFTVTSITVTTLRHVE